MQRIEIVADRRRAHDAGFRARVLSGDFVAWGTGVGCGPAPRDLHEPDLSLAACGVIASRSGVGGAAGSGADHRTPGAGEAPGARASIRARWRGALA